MYSLQRNCSWLIDPTSLEGGTTPQPMLFPVEDIDTALVFDTGIALWRSWRTAPRI
jgi:hypothetical protein